MKENPEPDNYNKAFESELKSLAQRAENLIKAPPLDMADILSQESFIPQRQRYLTKKIFTKSIISFATIVLCVLSILYFSDFQFSSKKDTFRVSTLTSAMIDEIDKDLKFAESVDELEDYALSGFIVSPDSQNYDIDEFIEFVAPTNKTYF